MKKSEFKVPDPPEHLRERSKKLWQDIMGLRVVSPGRLALFQTALELLDRADEAREKIAEMGLISTTKRTGAVHVNPLTKLEKDSRQQFAKIWLSLALNFDSTIDSRSF